MSGADERMHILQMIEDGKITAAEGLRLLNALTGAKAEGQAEGGGAEPTVGAPSAPRRLPPPSRRRPCPR